MKRQSTELKHIVTAARQIINAAGVATFRTPEAAVDGFSNIASFYQNQQLLHQTPTSRNVAREATSVPQ